MSKSRRQCIIDTVDDLVAQFMYYDRKEDEDLPSGAIDEALVAGEISVEEIVTEFRTKLSQAHAER